MYACKGFDNIGETTLYPWPARSSYFSIIYFEGFPEDAYYLYQSVCTHKKVLHIFPHWNWQPNKAIAVRAFTIMRMKWILGGITGAPAAI